MYKTKVLIVIAIIGHSLVASMRRGRTIATCSFIGRGSSVANGGLVVPSMVVVGGGGGDSQPIT